MNQMNRSLALYQSYKKLALFKSRKLFSDSDLSFSVKRALWSSAKCQWRENLKYLGHTCNYGSTSNSGGSSKDTNIDENVDENFENKSPTDENLSKSELGSAQVDSLETLSDGKDKKVKKKRTKKVSGEPHVAQSEGSTTAVVNKENSSEKEGESQTESEQKETAERMSNSEKYHEIKKTMMDPSLLTKELVVDFISQCAMKHEVGHTNLISSCPKLGKRVKLTEERNRLYINSTTGAFLCQYCKKYGEWEELKENISTIVAKKTRRKEMECFANSVMVQNFLSHSAELEELLASSVPVQNLTEEEFALMVHFHSCARIRKDIFMKYRIRYDPVARTLHLPYVTPNQEVVGVKVIQASLKDPEEGEESDIVLSSSYVPRNKFWQLFGWSVHEDVPVSLETVVLTASELDAMAITQVTGMCGLSLPKDALGLPIEILPSLEQCKKIIIWLGNNKTTWEATLRFAKKLGESRCYVLRPGILGEVSSVVDALEKKVNVNHILLSAVPIINEAITNFTNLRDDVFLELSHLEQSCGTKWQRFPTLTKILKGFRPGELTVFTGPTGSGKTTFLSEYSLDLSMQGVNTLWGSFEINNVRLAKMMLIQFALKNLHDHLDEYKKYAYGFESLPLHFLKFHGQENITKVMKTITHAVYVHDIRHVIIDNLQFMMGSSMDSSSDKFARQDMIIAAFRRFATEYGCHVTIIIHPRKEKDSEELTISSIFGSAKATQEADNVLILQDKKINSSRNRRFIQVTKNRFDGDLGMMLLKFDKETLSYAGLSSAKSKSNTPTSRKSAHPEKTGEESEDEKNEDDMFWVDEI